MQVVSNQLKPRRWTRSHLDGLPSTIVLRPREVVLIADDEDVLTANTDWGVEGDGVYKYYIIGDGITPAKDLPLHGGEVLTKDDIKEILQTELNKDNS